MDWAGTRFGSNRVLYSSFLNYRAALVERLTIIADLRLNAVQTVLAEVEADAQIFASAFGELHGEKGISAEMQAFAELFATISALLSSPYSRFIWPRDTEVELGRRQGGNL